MTYKDKLLLALLSGRQSSLSSIYLNEYFDHVDYIVKEICEKWGHDYSSFGDVPICNRCSHLNPKDGIRR